MNTFLRVLLIAGFSMQSAYPLLSIFFNYSSTPTNLMHLLRHSHYNFFGRLKKKNYKTWKYLYLLNAHRVFLKYNFNNSNFRFSFNGSMKLLSVHSKNTKLSRRTPLISNSFFSNYWFNYERVLNENRYYLVGGLISPLDWDYLDKIIYYKLTPFYNIERDGSFGALKHFKFQKKLILNNHLYDTISFLSYTDLFFAVNADLETTVNDQTDVSMSLPYMLLNNPDINRSNFLYANSTVLDLFDKYSSLFLDFKSAFNKFSSSVDTDLLFLIFYRVFWDCEIISRSFFELDNFDSVTSNRDYRTTRVPSLKSCKVHKFTPFNTFSKILFYFNRKQQFRGFFGFKRLLNTSFYYARPIPAFLIPLQSLRLTKDFYMSNFFFLINDLFISNLRIMRQIMKFYTLSLRKNKFFYINKSTVIFKKYKSHAFDKNTRSIRSKLKFLTNFCEYNLNLYFKFNKNFDVFFQSFDDFSFFSDLCDESVELNSIDRDDALRQPLFFTKELNSFASDFDGFVFLNDNFICDLPLEFIYNFKKLSYSFISKNELHRYLLSKYSRIARPQQSDNPDFEFFDDSHDIFDFNSNVSPRWQPFNSSPHHLSHFLLNDDISKQKLFYKNQIGFWEGMDDDVGELVIKRVRFKPGYMAQWRSARAALKLTLGLYFRYQHRLTRYLSRFNKFNRNRFILYFEMQLWNILLKSRFGCDTASIDLLLNYNFVYLNGLVCNNRYLQLFSGDFIQLIISFKYYTLYRWFLNWSLKKRIKLKNIVAFKAASESETEDKQRSNSLPNWILTNEGLNDDTLKYVEVDYFTLSVMVLYEPFAWADLNPYNLIKLRPTIMRLYNWKYIT